MAVVAGYLGGAYADRRLHTKPWLMLLGVLCGIAASFKELFSLVRRFQRQSRAGQGPAAPEGDAMKDGGTK